MFSIGLELTWRCVEKCVHCYIDDTAKFCATDELSTEEYKNILKQNTRRSSVLSSIFTRRASGSPMKFLKAALMFKAAGVKTFIKCVVMKQNFNSVETLYRLGKRLNLYVAASPKIVAGNSRTRAENYFLGDVALYKKFYALQSEYVPDDLTDQKLSRDEILDGASCGAGRCSFSIDPFGFVHACITFRENFGSVREDNLKTLRERARHLKLKNDAMREVTSKCKTCTCLEYCTVCVADLRNKNHGDFDDCGETFLETKAATVPVAESRLSAPNID